MPDLKIAVVLGSTREHRNGAAVADWVLEQAKDRTGATYELVDLRDHELPFFDEPMGPSMAASSRPEVVRFAEVIAGYDGFVFVTPEYNHSISAVLKNALDSVYDQWVDKAAALVSYGSYSGARAVEHLRGVLSELQVAHVRGQLGFNLFSDFTDYTRFTPGPQHAQAAQGVFDQLERWTGALKPLRTASAG